MKWAFGKTLQSITIARYKKAHNNLKHCLIICCVNSLKYNWIDEINKFCTEEDGVILGTRYNTKGKLIDMTMEETKAQIDSCPKEFFWIINIEKLRYNKKEKDNIVDYLNEKVKDGLGMVIIDELHHCKNPQSKQAQGILNLDTSISKMGMTGTILVNNPEDLYCPMAFIGLIKQNKWAYDNEYMIKDHWNNVIGYQNMDKLHDILYKSSIRRTKDLLDLPEKMYKQEWLDFSEDERKIFEQVIGQRKITDLDKIEPPTEDLAIITRMRQTTVASELLTSKKIKSTKFERLNDILEESKLNNRKVLVFCPFTEALKLGMEYCKEYNPKLIIGGMGSKVKDVVDYHENTEGFSVIFAQEQTLGVGYTLKNTSTVVFLSPPWNKATYDQCVDRCHRIGQKNTVQIIDLLIRDTYDELIYDKLHGKGAMSDILVDGKKSEMEAARAYFKKMNITFSASKYELEEDKLDSLLDNVETVF